MSLKSTAEELRELADDVRRARNIDPKHLEAMADELDVIDCGQK